MPTDAALLRAEMEQRGLVMLEAFVPLALKYPKEHDPRIAPAVSITRLLAGVASDLSPSPGVADRNGTDPVRTQLVEQVPPGAGLSAAQRWSYFAVWQFGVFCEPRKDAVDFPAVLRWLAACGYDGYVLVEQDVLPGMGTPRDSARRNRDYLRSLEPANYEHVPTGENRGAV